MRSIMAVILSLLSKVRLAWGEEYQVSEIVEILHHTASTIQNDNRCLFSVFVHAFGKYSLRYLEIYHCLYDNQLCFYGGLKTIK